MGDDESDSPSDAERCICEGGDDCSHEGRCEDFIARGVSDYYCDRCLCNKLATSECY